MLLACILLLFYLFTSGRCFACFSEYLMLNCWQYLARDRPTFCDIVEYLEPDLSDVFCERSFYHSDLNQPAASGAYVDDDDEAEDDETGFNSEEVDEDEYSLSHSPVQQQQPLLFGHSPFRATVAGATAVAGAEEEFPDLSDVEVQSTQSTLSYDSRRNRFRNSPSASPSTNQNSYLAAGSSVDAGGGSQRPYPPLRPRVASSGVDPPPPYQSYPPPLPPPAVSQSASSAQQHPLSSSSHKDPLVPKETAHLWQRPSNATRDHSSPDGDKAAAASSPSGSKDVCSSGSNGFVDQSRESSKSSGGSSASGGGGRNGFKNGHVTPQQQHLPPADHPLC